MVGMRKSDLIGWAVLIGIVLLLIEVTFFSSGLIFSLLVASGMMYLGRKRQHKSYGKVLFWVGVIFFTLSIFNMVAVKFLLFAILGYLIYGYAKSKRTPEVLTPVIHPPSAKRDEAVFTKKSLLDNSLFGEQRTPEQVYEWNDINIQTGIGDTLIDLSYTVLPKGETVIFIRGLVGNLQIHVPYDVEISVNHSVLAGATSVLQHQGNRLFNQRLIFQTESFEKADQRVKIFTSVLVGDLEVKRV